MNKFLDNLKKEAENQPTVALGVAVAATAAAAKLIESVSSARSKRAYTKAVNYRIKHRK